MAAQTQLNADRNDSEKNDSFRFKATVLATLARGFFQSIMRSIMTVCRRSRNHQGSYMKDGH